MWSCPHCGAAQATSARCWVCHRSSTTCSTCRHFRTSLAADVGWCALDRRRRPLTGLELRGCWAERSASPPSADPPAGRPAPAANPAWRDVPVRDFVPVDAVARATSPAPPEPAALEMSHLAVEPAEGWEGRVSLFGDLEH